MASNLTPALAIRDWYANLGNHIRPWVAGFFAQASKMDAQRGEFEMRLSTLFDNLISNPQNLDHLRLALIFRSSTEFALFFLGRDEAGQIERWREEVRLGVQPFAQYSREALDRFPEWKRQYDDAQSSWAILKAEWLDNEPLEQFLREQDAKAVLPPDLEAEVAVQAEELRELYAKLRKGEH